MLDRFPFRVQLSDTDVEVVTREVLLQKQPTARSEVEKLLSRDAGEVSRQLQDTKIGQRSSDQDTVVDDYPLLPVRRRFWEECFRPLDAAGTQVSCDRNSASSMNHWDACLNLLSEQLFPPINSIPCWLQSSSVQGYCPVGSMTAYPLCPTHWARVYAAWCF